MMALRSPLSISGKRELRMKMRTTSLFSTPSRITRTGGIMMPSWKTDTACGLIEPGTEPPMSQRWPHASAKANSRPSWKTGMTNTMSGRWLTAPPTP